MMEQKVHLISKAEWIARYGGQALLDQEGFEVIPCNHCQDPICHGWRVRKVTQ